MATSRELDALQLGYLELIPLKSIEMMLTKEDFFQIRMINGKVYEVSEILQIVQDHNGDRWIEIVEMGPNDLVTSIRVNAIATIGQIPDDE